MACVKTESRISTNSTFWLVTSKAVKKTDMSVGCDMHDRKRSGSSCGHHQPSERWWCRRQNYLAVGQKKYLDLRSLGFGVAPNLPKKQKAAILHTLGLQAIALPRAVPSNGGIWSRVSVHNP